MFFLAFSSRDGMFYTLYIIDVDTSYLNLISIHNFEINLALVKLFFETFMLMELKIEPLQVCKNNINSSTSFSLLVSSGRHNITWHEVRDLLKTDIPSDSKITSSGVLS